MAVALGGKSRQAAHPAISLAPARMTCQETPKYVEIGVAVEQVDALLVPILLQAMTGDPMTISLVLTTLDRHAQLLAHLRG